MRAGTRAESIRIIEHTVWEARHHGIRLPDTAPDLIVALEWLGFLYLLESKPARAEPPLKDALRFHRRRHGVDHPHVRYLLARLTDAYEAQGKEVAAIPRLERRLAADLRHGPIARRIVRSRAKLFRAYWSAGRIQDAFGLYHDALVGCEQSSGPDTQESVVLRHQLAWAYLDAEFPHGVPLLERNIVALERADSRRPWLASRRSELGMVYIWFGRPSDAIKTLQRGLDDIAGLDDTEVRRVRRELLRLYSNGVELQEEHRSRPSETGG